MDDRLYWLWLQYVLGYGAKLKAFLEEFHSPKEFYDLGEEKWKAYFSRRKAQQKRALESKPEDFLKTLEFCDKHNLHIVTAQSEYYPQNLLTIEDYPALLFVRGDYTCLNFGVPFGVIGSRDPSVYGENCAKDIVTTLCESDALIISGGAIGIDSVAHKTAMLCGSKTVLVMGCGHGYDYLPENADLRKAVTHSGALISEYPPFTPVNKGTFPLRNRIISGMSKAIVIVEAADRSGTFSTATHALKQGRQLFVLPGDVNSGKYAGSNRLITDGATAIFSGKDVLKKCSLLTEKDDTRVNGDGNVFSLVDEVSAESKTKQLKRKRPSKKSTSNKEIEENKEEKIKIIPKKLPEGISKNAEIVYNIMSGGINELDEIKRKSSLEVRNVLVALTELEMLGFACADGPNKYRIN